MIILKLFKKFKYMKSSNMPGEKKGKYFDKTYLTLFKLHIAIPIKNNIKGENKK